MIKVSTSITAVKAEPVCEDMLQHTYVENNHLVYSLSLNEQSILDISLERSVSILPILYLVNVNVYSTCRQGILRRIPRAI